MATGTLGESMASVIFQRIRWAPPVRVGQDIGDDFITFARDTAAPETHAVAYDLAAPVLVQVKSSATAYLTRPDTVRGEPGWWFAETETDHFDHWLSFGLPYLLVLVDIKNEIAYWAEVRGSAIKSTGKGRKIFVPASQTVDDSHVDALNKAAVARRSNDLEGTAWTGRFADLPPADRLRYALVMPRLIAPHRNRPLSAIAYEEAAAMLMQHRLSDLSHLSREGVCPKPEEWAASSEWGWRFVSALDQVLRTGDSTQFQQLAEDARHGFERDACIVAQACIAYVTDRADHAATLLKTQRNTKLADRGWIRAQQAAALLELDRPTQASKSAQEALFALKSLDGDLTVSAIRGSAAAVLYSLAGFGRGDLAATISAQDNAGAWWRAQDVSWALSEVLELRFLGWAGSTPANFESSTAKGELTTAAWNAAFSGAWGSWRHLSAQISQLTLTSTKDPVEVAAGLTSLIFAGEVAHAKAAAGKIWADGPEGALRDVISTLASNAWSGRAEGPAMGVLASAGDLLADAAADALVERCLGTLRSQGSTRRFANGWSDRWSELAAALPRILVAASAEAHEACAKLVTEEFSGPEPVAHSLLRIANGLRLAELSAETITALLAAATVRSDHYGLGLLEVLGPASNKAIAEIRRRARNGSPEARRSLLVVGSDERADYLAFGRDAAKIVRQMVADAIPKNGVASFSVYVSEPVHDLALSALRTADNRLWKALTDALEAGVIAEEQLLRTIRMIARKFTNLPPHVQKRIRKMAPTVKGSKTGLSSSGDFSSASAELNIAAGNVSDDEIEALLLHLRRTDAAGFVNAIQLWNRPHKIPFLATMAVDIEAQVRSQAAISLIDHTHQFPADAQEAASVLRIAFKLNEGCQMADAIAQALKVFPSPVFADLSIVLQNHPSALVRSRLQVT